MDDRAERNRFLVFTVIRLSGLAMFLLGLAIAFGDMFRPGGLPAAGIPLAFLGLAQAVLAPKILRRIKPR
jgi:hypothetical protein